MKKLLNNKTYKLERSEKSVCSEIPLIRSVAKFLNLKSKFSFESCVVTWWVNQFLQAFQVFLSKLKDHNSIHSILLNLELKQPILSKNLVQLFETFCLISWRKVELEFGLTILSLYKKGFCWRFVERKKERNLSPSPNFELIILKNSKNQWKIILLEKWTI